MSDKKKPTVCQINFAIRHAIVQQELEGANISREARADLKSLVEKDITFEEYASRVLARHQNKYVGEEQ